MDTKTGIVLTFALLGIILLLFINHQIQPKIISISNITSNQIDERVSILATITKIITFKENTFQILTLQDKTGKIEATLFSNERLNINETQLYLITGKLSIYKNNTQIIIDKIILKNS